MREWTLIFKHFIDGLIIFILSMAVSLYIFEYCYPLVLNQLYTHKLINNLI